MRKFFFFLILVVAAGVGVLITIGGKGSWGEGVVAVGLCLLFGLPIAAALTGLGGGYKRSRHYWHGSGSSGAHRVLFKGDTPIRRWDRL